MSRGRPEIPPSWVVDLDHVVNLVYLTETDSRANPDGVPWMNYDTDIIIPVYESFPEETAKNLIFVLDHKIYKSVKSRFVEYLETYRSNEKPEHADKFYIYDKWKAGSYSHKKGYKQITVEVPHHDGGESVFLPVYWRIN